MTIPKIDDMAPTVWFTAKMNTSCCKPAPGRRISASSVSASRRTLRAPISALAVALLVAGCALWRPTTVPLRVVTVPAACTAQPDTLLVLLPGSWSMPEDFEQEGFVAAVRERQLAVDLLLVDAHVGYYRDRVIVERLRADVIEPARARGYRHIWIGGISIGAFGALTSAQALPGEVEGVIALAPYLGSPQIAQTIADAGGLSSWTPADGPTPANDVDLTLWRGLRQWSTASSPARPLFLGYGLDDRFVANDKVLAAALPAPQVFTAEGGHDWSVWKLLWQRMLPSLPFRSDPGCTSR